MDSISNDEAEKLLKRALKHLSAKYNTYIELHKCSTGEVRLIGCTGECASFDVPDHYVNMTTFASMTCLLYILLIPGTSFEINQTNETWIDIDFSKEFGTTIEELKVKFDLLSI